MGVHSRSPLPPAAAAAISVQRRRGGVSPNLLAHFLARVRSAALLTPRQRRSLRSRGLVAVSLNSSPLSSFKMKGEAKFQPIRASESAAVAIGPLARPQMRLVVLSPARPRPRPAAINSVARFSKFGLAAFHQAPISLSDVPLLLLPSLSVTAFHIILLYCKTGATSKRAVGRRLMRCTAVNERPRALGRMTSAAYRLIFSTSPSSIPQMGASYAAAGASPTV